MRYIGYSFGLSTFVFLVAASWPAWPRWPIRLLAIVAAIGYVAIIVVQFLADDSALARHERDGLAVVDLADSARRLVFWFVPGTRGENDYGKQPPPNTAGVIVLACVVPLV